MTKKDYIKAAEIIRDHGSPPKMVEAFIEFFTSDNPQFDVDRFIDACVGKAARPRR
jgi:hypothetical protein